MEIFKNEVVGLNISEMEAFDSIAKMLSVIANNATDISLKNEAEELCDKLIMFKFDWLEERN